MHLYVPIVLLCCDLLANVPINEHIVGHFSQSADDSVHCKYNMRLPGTEESVYVNSYDHCSKLDDSLIPRLSAQKLLLSFLEGTYLQQ